MPRPILAALVAALAFAAPARAAIISTFDFAGTCSDCDGTATAHLALSDYAVGSAITTSNFLSFTYDATNLITTPFTISREQVDTIGGAISPPLPGPEDFFIASGNVSFNSFSFGYWCTSTTGGCFADFGQDHSWSLASTQNSTDPTTVPEPLTATLLGAPLLALVALRRRAHGTTPT